MTRVILHRHFVRVGDDVLGYVLAPDLATAQQMAYRVFPELPPQQIDVRMDRRSAYVAPLLGAWGTPE